MTTRRPTRSPRAAETEGNPERGAALILVLIMIVILSGIAWSLMVAATAQSKYSHHATLRSDALILADNGLAKGIGILLIAASADNLDGNLGGLDFVSGGWVNVVGTLTVLENGTVVRCKRIDGNTNGEPPVIFKVIAEATIGTGANAVTRRIQVIYSIDKPVPDPLPGNGAGAVVGAGSFTTLGNILIDGRDHNSDGTLRADDDALHAPSFAITGTLDQGGSSDIAGGTQGPTAPGGTLVEGSTIDLNTFMWDREDNLEVGIQSDLFDNDGDGSIDEDNEWLDVFANDGYDNDGDGSIDEMDGIDNNGDGTIDEPGEPGDRGDVNGDFFAGLYQGGPGNPIADWANDGYDNDGDRYADEDGFPETFGGIFNLSPGNVSSDTENSALRAALVATAKDNGTFFQVPDDDDDDGDEPVNAAGMTYDDWRTTPDALDGGDIVLIVSADDDDDDDMDFGAFRLPDNFGGEPTLLIVTNAKYTEGSGHEHDTHHDTVIGPIKAPASPGGFVGVLVADTINKANGNGRIIGAITAWNDVDLTKFGNGTFEILFSSDVVANLPGPDPIGVPPVPVLLHWGEIPLLPADW